MRLPALIYPPGMGFWRAMQAGLIAPVQSEAYLAFVRELPCVLGGGKAEPHHMVGHGLKPVGGKVNDFLTFPLSPANHRPDFKGSFHHLGSSLWEVKHGDQRMYVMQTLIEAVHRGVLRVG